MNISYLRLERRFYGDEGRRYRRIKCGMFTLRGPSPLACSFSCGCITVGWSGWIVSDARNIWSESGVRNMRAAYRYRRNFNGKRAHPNAHLFWSITSNPISLPAVMSIHLKSGGKYVLRKAMEPMGKSI
jgi:hypothetical protein